MNAKKSLYVSGKNEDCNTSKKVVQAHWKLEGDKSLQPHGGSHTTTEKVLGGGKSIVHHYSKGAKWRQKDGTPL
jgi:hypothetical protein